MQPIGQTTYDLNNKPFKDQRRLDHYNTKVLGHSHCTKINMGFEQWACSISLCQLFKSSTVNPNRAPVLLAANLNKKNIL